MRSLLYILLVFSFSLNAQSSKKIEILNADSTFANAKVHPEYWRLINNVSFKHNDAIMHCDSAYHYVADNKMKAFGRIKINQGDSIILTGNKLTYHASKNQVDLKGNVIFIDKHMKLLTNRLYYDLSSNIVSYPDSGKIIDNQKIIYSKRGAYYSVLHKFTFEDSVQVDAKNYKILTDNMHYNSNSETTYFFGPSYIFYKNKSIYCENGWYNTKTEKAQFKENAILKTNEHSLRGDSLYYNKKLGYGKAMQNIVLHDTIENIKVFGNFAEYFESQERVEVTESPLLEMPFESDTLFMHSNKFISIQKEGEKMLLAYDKVKMFKSDIQGKCDSLSYSITDSLLSMYVSPILWTDEFQMTADSIIFFLKKGGIERLYFYPNPMVIAREDSLDYNQIKGKHMTAYFSKNNMNRIDVEGNGQSMFVVVDEEKNKKIGLNYTECSDMTLYFKNKKLNMINYKIKPNSVTTPIQDIKEDNRYLKGLRWRGDERPNSRKDIFIE